MSDYTPATDFSAKDALSTGNPEKAILGADVDAELDAIATAIATKLNSSGYTAADVLSKLLTVDGAGSSLDADNVDGVGPFAIGTWVPTFSSLSNLDAVTDVLSNYIRLGSIVIVFGIWSIDQTGAGAASFKATLPVASNFAAAGNAAGNISCKSFSMFNTSFTASTADDLLSISGNATAAAAAADAVFFGAYKVI